MTLPAGVILDKLGPKFTCAIGAVLFGGGVALFAISKPGLLNLFTPGFILMGCGGPPIVLSFINLSNLYPNRKGLIITVFNVGIDASSIMFFLFEVSERVFPCDLIFDTEIQTRQIVDISILGSFKEDNFFGVSLRSSGRFFVSTDFVAKEELP